MGAAVKRGLVSLVVGLGVVAALAGCNPIGAKPVSAPASAPGEDGLKVHDCVALVSASGSSYDEVWCTDPSATAAVTTVDSAARGVAGAQAQPDCPSGTDVLLTPANFAAGPTSRRTPGPAAFGYACARNVNPPHPGDPGEGGGPDIVEGDCVYVTPVSVTETRCDGTGDHKPAYKVYRIALSTFGCDQPGTDLAFGLGPAPAAKPLARKTACAKRV
jgi:hypothetical protein